MAVLVFAWALAVAQVVPPGDAAGARLLVATSMGSGGRSARQLYNLGMASEERGQLADACERYLGARLAPKLTFADELYSRRAALRLLHLLVGRDEDAALATALLFEGDGPDPVRAPSLFRLLGRGVDEPRSDGVDILTGTVLSARYDKRGRRLWIELEGDDEKVRILELDGTLGCLVAGHRVTAVVRRIFGDAHAGWRVIALGGAGAAGWQVLRASNLNDEQRAGGTAGGS